MKSTNDKNKPSPSQEKDIFLDSKMSEEGLFKDFFPSEEIKEHNFLKDDSNIGRRSKK